MPRLHQIGCFGVSRNGHLHSACAISHRNTGFNTFCSLNRDRKVGTVGRAIACRHQRQFELLAALFGERQTHKPAAVSHHEINGLGGHEFGGHHQITLVFAIFFVNQNHHAARAKLVNNLRNRRNRRGGDGVRRACERNFCRHRVQINRPE